MLRISVLACTLFIFGCGDSSNPGADMGQADLSGPELDMLRLPDTVTGRVVDDNGSPRAGLSCQLCSKQICLTGKTAADGKVGFTPKMAGAYHFRAFSDDPITFGDVFYPVPIGAEFNAPGFMKALGDAVAPAAGPGQMVTVAGGGTFNFAGNITIDVPANSLTLANLDPSGMLYAIAVPRAKVPPALLAVRTQLDDGVYLTLPFGALCNKAAGKDCKLTFPITKPDGTKVELWMPNFDTAVLELAGEGTVTSNKVVTDATKGVAALGWVVLYAK